MESVNNRTIHVTVFVVPTQSMSMWDISGTKTRRKGAWSSLHHSRSKMYQTTDTGIVPAVAVTSLSGCTHWPCRGSSWGQEMVCTALHPMFLCCLSMPSETRSKMQNVFHAGSINCSMCLFPSFLRAGTQGNPGLEHVAVELHCGAVLLGRGREPDAIRWSWRSWCFKWVYS